MWQLWLLDLRSENLTLASGWPRSGGLNGLADCVYRQMHYRGLATLALLAPACTKRRATVPAPTTPQPITVSKAGETGAVNSWPDSSVPPASEPALPKQGQAQRQPCKRIRPGAVAAGVAMLAGGIYLLKTSSPDPQQTSGTTQPRGIARVGGGIGLTVCAPSYDNGGWRQKQMPNKNSAMWCGPAQARFRAG